MKISFYKYHGAGNDFIIIDRTETPDIELSAEEISFLCDRRKGIGADGLMYYDSLDGNEFTMSYFNADGKESTMCGNGGRCMAAYWKHKGNEGNQVRFKSIDGDHTAFFRANENVNLEMRDIKVVKVSESGYIMDTGSPHMVRFVDDIETLNVQEEGRKIRYSDEFAPEGINVNFAQIKGDKIYIRTYERGVEAETMSCGTGSVAAAVAASLQTGALPDRHELVAPGGKLFVSFTKKPDGSFRNVLLEGPAIFVFKGTIQL